MKKIYIILVGILALGACTDPDEPYVENISTGGLMDVTSASNSYVVGNPDGPYTVELFAHQHPTTQITSIDIYKTFYGTDLYKDVDGKDSIVSYVSNEVLDRTLQVTNSNPHFLSTNFTFDEFRAGLTAKGSPLPEVDGGFRIGDRFELRIVANMSDGSVSEQAYKVNFTVSTRYAGNYNTLKAAYYRIGVFYYDENIWADPYYSIESVDATTYRVLEWLGPFNDNEWYFEIVDGVISYPEKTPDGADQLLNDQPLITCESNPTDFSDVGVACGTDSNYVINDDVEGKDQLIMSVGYFTAGSGPRIFYQELEKIVE